MCRIGHGLLSRWDGKELDHRLRPVVWYLSSVQSLVPFRGQLLQTVPKLRCVELLPCIVNCHRLRPLIVGILVRC